MATLSTLELMLQQIQTQENLQPYGDHQPPPTLPPRPVSKGRTPARRAILSFHIQEFGGKKGEIAGNKSKRTKREGFAFVEENNCSKEIEEKGIIGIQKCFRGYQARCNYHQLKEGITALQSFIRGENARRKFQHSIKRLMPVVVTDTQVKQKNIRKTLRNQETTIIYLQSVVRGWLCRRRLNHCGNVKNATIKNAREMNQLYQENSDNVAVSNAYILDLQRQVLRMETTLRHKKAENLNLELQIQQIDRKWQIHNAKMDSMEKTWQDEFASIQVNLASARERMTKEATHLPHNRLSEGNDKVNLTIREILELRERDIQDMGSRFCVGNSLDNVLDSRRCLEEELRKLKGRFKTWKKDFKVRLKEIKKTFDQFGHFRTEKIQKRCCVR